MKNQPVKCMIQTIQKLFNRVILFEMMNIKLFGSGQKEELVRDLPFYANVILQPHHNLRENEPTALPY